jgi:hypothetical protein
MAREDGPELGVLAGVRGMLVVVLASAVVVGVGLVLAWAFSMLTVGGP